jgi:Outer membrane protein beta-barrel domain
MRKLLLVVVAVFVMQSIDAQVRLGFTAGPNYSTQIWNSNTYSMGVSKYRLQYHFGINMDIPVAEDWSINPEFLFSYQGSKLTQENSVLQNQTTTNIGYAKMPVCLQYMIDKEKMFWQFSAGGYISRVGITNYTFFQNDVNLNSGRLRVGTTTDDQLMPWDYGLRLKAGFEIKKGIGMHFFYDHGIKDISPQMTRAYNRVIGGSLSYMFNLSRADRYSRYPDYYNY